MLAFALLAVASLVVPNVAAAAPTVVATCGTTVDDGILASDLDCSATPGFAVTLAKGGRLDLAGHTIVSGSTVSLVGGGGVRCLGDCTVDGGGGSLVSGVALEWPDAQQTSGVTLPYPLRGHASISDLTISGYMTAASAQVLDVTSSTLVGNFSGCFARDLTIASTTISNPFPWGHQSASGRRVLITDSVLEGGGGVTTRLIDVYRSTITGMHHSGIQATGNRPLRRLYAEESVIDDNCVIGISEVCADLLSTRRPPRLVDTTCSTSLRYNLINKTWTTWGICSED